jgi:hypothetical protein
MKTNYPLMLLVITALVTGCADQKAAERKVREDAAAKARAEAARKEMEAVPKVFRPQYHNKRLEPETPPAVPAPTPPTKKP